MTLSPPRLIAAVATATLVATATEAGGPTVIPEEAPVPALPASVAHHWSGAYGGLTLGSLGGEIQFLPGAFDEHSGGQVIGVQLGYQMQRGSFVYGGELAYSDVRDADFFGQIGMTRALDLKGRLGYAADRFVIYGLIGYSRADLYVDGGEWQMTGVSYGLGAEYAVSDSVSLGLEYLNRDLEGEETSGFPVDAEGKVNTLSFRANIAF